MPADETPNPAGSGGDGGLRRRHSGHSDNEDLEPRMEDGQNTEPSQSYETSAEGTRRRSIGSGNNGTPRRQKSISSGVDFDGLQADEDTERASKHSNESSPKVVRFSTDIERAPYEVTDTRSAPGSRTASSSHGPGLGLSVITSNVAPSFLEEGTVGSPPSFASATSPTSPGSSSSSAPRRIPTFPLSPKTRARGWSLRRSMFNRNVADEATEAARGSVIELQDTEPGSSSSSFAAAARTRPQPFDAIISPVPESSPRSSKKRDTVVTVSPHMEVYEDLELPPRPQHLDKKKGLSSRAALPSYDEWIRERARRNATLNSVKAGLGRLRKVILRIQEIPPSKDGRHIDLDAGRKKALIDERTGRVHVGNGIRSTRYSAWNFFPRQLFAQFSKLANFYFLSISILQMIPGLSTTGTYTTIIPLMFFVALSMGKEGYDDLRRHRLDKVENNREAEVLQAYQPVQSLDTDAEAPATPIAPIHWAKKKWQNLQVGDIVKLNRDDPVPADLVLLHAENADQIAYIETMALDGETNLKSKQAPPSVSKLCATDDRVAHAQAHFVVEDPNIDLYNFEGRVLVDGQAAPLTNNEILYRGSVLRNTPSAIGMVIYSGEECKIRMNANKNPRIKAPSLQWIVNKVVVAIVIFVILLAIFCTVAYQIWSSAVESHSWYLNSAKVAFVPILVSFIVMFNTLIPLSLYVSMEIVKVAQMVLMNDIDMYDPITDTPFEARTSTINEELGQVSYIFSDKTGTLTDNMMKFRKLSVAGTAWLHDFDLKADGDEYKLRHKKRNKGKGKAKSRKSRVSEGTLLRKSGLSAFKSDKISEEEEEEGHEEPRWKSSAFPSQSRTDMRTKHLIRYIQHKPHTVFARKARLFLLSVALCHTCLPEQTEDGEIEFQASSPDELALVKAAQELGFLVIHRDSGTITLQYDGPDGEPVREVYQTLDVIEFSSKRKRMSISVRFPDGRICLFCKGADSIVMQRLRHARLANEKVVEIEKRANKRKSLEASIAIARKSEQVERQNSFASGGRKSFSMTRPSIGGLSVGRPSVSNKLPAIRDELDEWLREQENDVQINMAQDNAEFYEPRPSQTLNRASMAYSDGRSSMQLEDYDDLVDEALAVDEPAVIERTFQHINDFATEGLRTLLYGYRFIDEQDYQGWRKIYLEATTSLVERQAKIEKAGELIEQDLELAGATAIEDKLQKGVPESIDKLRRANIKMWMLTGDKRETAINIGHSCRLIKDYSTVVVLDHEAGEVEQNIAAALVSIQGGGIAHTVIVVDGQTLALIEAEPSVRELFFDLAIVADSVVCCRASPSQKALLVHAIRKRVNKSVTLAIGDGANDIAMIQEAHVGIGITGKEGLQAARTSDYSIAQFRFLTKLLLVHGRWNYIRLCKYTLCTFWKESLFYLTQALYQRWNGYTGTSLYESWSLSMFNTLFTSLPVIFMGVFEKDLLPSTLLAVPELYTKGQRNGAFNWNVYLGWIFMAASEAVGIYFIMLYLYGYINFTTDNGLFAMGDMTFTACIIFISLKIQMIEMHSKSLVVAISLFCSIGGWLLWNIILSKTYSNNQLYNVRDGWFDRFGRNWLWWLTLILIVIAACMFEVIIIAGRAGLFPTDVDTFQALERDLEVRKRFEEASAMELQAGWDRGKKRSSVELLREEQAQAEREEHIQELLDNRPEHLEERPKSEASPKVGFRRKSTDLERALKRGFGTVRRQH